MHINLSKMERPSYLSSINEHNWRASVRQQSQPNLPNFFRDIMDEYEKVTGAESPNVTQISPFTSKIGHKRHRWTPFQVLRNLGKVPWRSDIFGWRKKIVRNYTGCHPIIVRIFYFNLYLIFLPFLLMIFNLIFLHSYERMHLYKPRKENNEDTVMHEYIHDTFKETFRDSNYEVIW